ncbi:hypothetical protein JCM10212_002790 [Sporobolomyces blumeae]
MRALLMFQSLVIVGLGNYTHPLTRHSVGQVLLKNLAHVAASSPNATGSPHLTLSKSGRHASWTTRILLNSNDPTRDPLELLFILPKALMNVSGPTVVAAADGFLPPIVARTTSREPPVLPTPPTSLSPTDDEMASPLKSEAAPARRKKTKEPVAPLKPMYRLITIQDDLDLAPSQLKAQRGGGPRGHNGLRSLFGALGGSRDFHRLWVGIGRPDDRSKVAGYVLSPLGRDEVRACEWDEDGRRAGQVLEKAWNEVMRIGYEED